MSAYATAVLGSVLVLAAILELLRRRQLTEKYAVLWLAVGTGILLLTIFPGVLTVASRLTGIAIPANLVFFVGIVFLVGVALHLSWELSRLENETRSLAEELALLRLDVEQVLRPDAAASLGVPVPPATGPDHRGPGEGEPQAR